MEDFIDQNKDKLNYYYFEKYHLDKIYYDRSVNYYKTVLKNVQENIEIDWNAWLILKLKMLAQCSATIPWDFPIVVYKDYYVACGSGKIFIDHFLFNRKNEKTILVSDYPISYYSKIKSLKELLLQLNIEGLQFYVKKGIIAAMYKKIYQFDIDRHFYFYNYKDTLISKIKKIDVDDLSSIISFLKEKETFFK